MLFLLTLPRAHSRLVGLILSSFDLVVGMDESNVENLLQISAGRYDDKIKLFRPGGVPDPWYTGDFEETYKLVTAGCRDWLQWIKDRQ